MECGRGFITDGMWKDFYNGWNLEGLLQRIESGRVFITDEI
jgi:hypothetical protein